MASGRSRPKYVILVTRRWKRVTWGDWGLLDYSLEQAWNHTWAQLLEHHYYSFKYITIIVHSNLSTPTDEIIFIGLHVQFTSMLLVGLSSESNVRVMVPKLSQWQALPWDAKQIHVAFLSYFYCYGEFLDSFHTKIKSPSPKPLWVPVRKPVSPIIKAAKL